MRRTIVVALTVLAGLLSPGAEADLKPGGYMSPNVTWVANLPVDAPGVGARLVEVDGQKRLYVTGSKGLTIYDVTDPALPVPLGHATFPHWQNEDVSVSADGSLVIIAQDIRGRSIVIDASLVNVPHVVGIIPSAEHTITCVVADCSWAYGRTGAIFDLSDPAAPVIVEPGWKTQVEAVLRAEGVLEEDQQLPQRAHDMNVDDAGYVITDTVPRLMLDVSDPAHPEIVTLGWPNRTGVDLAYQHNNLRTRADEWAPRIPGDDEGPMRPGELMLANGETNETITCDGSTNGPFATWDVRNWDRGEEMQYLDVYRPLSGMYSDGNPAVNVLGCSGHWFTYNERHSIAAQGFYEHGVRFLHVDPGNGDITEVGFFQPVVGSASAAYWIDDTYVYTVDYARGIDILRFDAEAPVPTQAQIDASWLAKLNAAPVPAAAVERLSCRLAIES